MKFECVNPVKIRVGWKQSAGRRSGLGFPDALAERFREQPGKLLREPPAWLQGLHPSCFDASVS